MEQDNDLQIVQQIMACGILDCSPHREREVTPLKSKAFDICDDGWNIDTDMSGLLVAIENVVYWTLGILLYQTINVHEEG